MNREPPQTHSWPTSLLSHNKKFLVCALISRFEQDLNPLRGGKHGHKFFQTTLQFETDKEGDATVQS